MMENNTAENNLQQARFKESSGTGVLGSLIFIGVMIVAMIILSSIIN
ncbi:hypothetical protein HDR58_05870 [bacterium]|nr:hypothetical protein [bacterium]